jgi:hypothetical protein
MKSLLDIFFFQIIYTLVSIQNIFPYFSHRDLFMRNILGLKETDRGKSYLYNYNNRTYCIPQKKFYPKITDFGMSNLNEKYKDMKLFASDYKDLYNILVDVYYGDYLNSVGLKELCKFNNKKIAFLKEYFSTFFNVSVMDKHFNNYHTFLTR